MPLANRRSTPRLLRALESQRAIFLGEHHPALRDHLLQAALLRAVCSKSSRSKPLAVGLEAVQQQFQPVLDDFVAGRISEQDVYERTEWERRWYWSFDAYAPILRICRERQVELIALDVDSEDKSRVEVDGLASLDRAKLDTYIPDARGFERFGSSPAYDEYVAYTLRPPYVLMRKAGQKMTMSTDAQRDMSFDNFLARQSLRDEAMASRSAAWLTEHPDGQLLGLMGVNHVKFSCGVPARTARMLPGGRDVVTSVLLNPTPANTFLDGPQSLRLCDGTAVANEACVLNPEMGEIQNYVLQVPYGGVPGVPGGMAVRDEASSAARQAKRGSSVLALSDYIIFSPAP